MCLRKEKYDQCRKYPDGRFPEADNLFRRMAEKKMKPESAGIICSAKIPDGQTFGYPPDQTVKPQHISYGVRFKASPNANHSRSI